MVNRTKVKEKLIQHKWIIIVVVFFTIVYSLISIVNHYNFRTYALDLGAYTNALYDYIHFQWNDSTVFKVVKENLLADHFDLYLILFSPLSLIFKSYSLLVVQIFFVLLGGIGVYKYFIISGRSNNLAVLASIYFYLFFGIFSSLAFDYHSNVVAASLIPWFFVYLKQRRFIATSLMLLIILVSKENISLWMAFISLGLIWEYRKMAFWRNFLIASFMISIAYYLLITTVVMPYFSNNHSYPHFHYSILGKNSQEAFMFLVQHPFESLEAMFVNHTNHPLGDYIKLEFMVILMVSGFYILFRKPMYILMLIPVFFQKLFHDNYIMWSFSAQYSVEYAPVMAIGIFTIIAETKKALFRKILVFLALAGCLTATLRIMDSTILHTHKLHIRVYQKAHYQREYDVKDVYEILSIIPSQAVVSAQSPFLPHLALRDNIYQFPIIKDADYIVFSLKEAPYPLNIEDFIKETNDLIYSNRWEIVSRTDDLFLLRKAEPIATGDTEIIH